MKTVKDIENECELETKDKTFDEKLAYKLGVFKAHYEISIEIIEMKDKEILDLENDIIYLKSIIKNNNYGN